MLIGYARPSRLDRKPELQLDALREAGCKQIFEETVSGANRGRPGLKSILSQMRTGDTLVIWKLHRLARSVPQLLETVELLKTRGIGLKILSQDIDTTRAEGRLFFAVFSAIIEFEQDHYRERIPVDPGTPQARGRPRSLSEKDLKEAHTLLNKPGISVEDIAYKLGVSVTTLYRYLAAARPVAREDFRVRTNK